MSLYHAYSKIAKKVGVKAAIHAPGVAAAILYLIKGKMYTESLAREFIGAMIHPELVRVLIEKARELGGIPAIE